MLGSNIKLNLVALKTLKEKKHYLHLRKLKQIKQVTIIIIPLFLIFEFATKQKVKMTASLLLKEKHPIYTISEISDYLLDQIKWWGENRSWCHV